MFILLGCPDHVELKVSDNGRLFGYSADIVSSFPEVSKSYRLYDEYFETYTIQPETFAGRDWYLSDSGHAIWYHDGKWRVGKEENKGTSTSVFYTDDDDECPHQPKSWGFRWKYYDGEEDKWWSDGHLTISRES